MCQLTTQAQLGDVFKSSEGESETGQTGSTPAPKSDSVFESVLSGVAALA